MMPSHLFKRLTHSSDKQPSVHMSKDCYHTLSSRTHLCKTHDPQHNCQVALEHALKVSEVIVHLPATKVDDQADLQDSQQYSKRYNKSSKQ